MKLSNIKVGLKCRFVSSENPDTTCIVTVDAIHNRKIQPIDVSGRLASWSCEVWELKEYDEEMEALQARSLIRVQPRHAYKVLGSSGILNPNKVYSAVWARNQPRWQVDEKIFVLGTLLQKGEYTIIK